MADSDDDEIAVWVVPKIDEAAADEAEHKLRDKFKDAASGVTDGLKDLLDGMGDHHLGDPLSNLGDKVHDVLSDSVDKGLSDPIKDLVGHHGGLDDVFDSLGQHAGSAISKGFGDALHDIGTGRLGDELKNVGSHLSDIVGSLVGSLDGKLDGLQKAAGGIGNVVSGNSGDPLGDITGVIQGAKDFGIHIPGPLGNLQGLNDMINHLNEQPGQAEDFLSRNIPGLGVVDNLINKWPTEAGEWIHQNIFGQAPTPTPAPSPKKEDASVDSLYEGVFGKPDLSKPDKNKPDKSHADLMYEGVFGQRFSPSSISANDVDLRSTSATITAGQVSFDGSVSLPMGVTGADPRLYLPGTVPGTVGTAGGELASAPERPGTVATGKGFPGDVPRGLARPDSGDGYAALGSFAQGGVLPGDSPGYDNMIGLLPGGSAVGLEGGEGVIKPGAMQTPGVSDIVAELNQHYDDGTPQNTTVGGVPAPTAPTANQSVLGGIFGDGAPAGGGAPGGPQPGQAPGKQPGSPAATSPLGGPQAPGAPAGQEQPGQVIDPHGEGPGFGISGGLIGMAEGAASSAAGMAAGAGSFGAAGGAGSAATQLGFQEANKAVGYAGQELAILGIEMPMDTFSLNDNRYSNAAQSWIGKVGLGLVGGHNDTPNIAGQTQAPLTGSNQSQGSPLGGQQQGNITLNIGTQNNASNVDHEANNNNLLNTLNSGPGLGAGY